MPKKNAILIGTAGVYYVMYQLAKKGFHASCTMGNAPYIDILVSSEDGERTIAIQVKTAQDAMRSRGRGNLKKPYGVDFALGARAARLNRKNVLFAFVDLAQVIVYLVPSSNLSEFCKEWIDKPNKWVRFKPTLEWMKPYREAWEQIERYVDEPKPK